MARWVGWFAPGLPQLSRGKTPEGFGVFLLWVALLILGVARFDRVLGSLSGGLAEWVALLTLLGGLGWAWLWSFRESREVERGGLGGKELSSTDMTPEWAAFRENRLAMLALGVVMTLYLVMLLAPFLAPYGSEARTAYQATGEMFGIRQAPSVLHIMGTDQYSQDVFSRILYGSRISLTIGLIAVVISVTLGAFLGAVAGYWRGWLEMAIMRLVDMIMAIPRLVILMAIVAIFRQYSEHPSIFVVIVALAFTQWPFTARMVRGEILALKEREFAEAARALGFSRTRILFRHLLPNALGPLIVVATLGIGNAIILEAGLSFLGLGVEAGTPSWGSMVAEGRDSLLLGYWWIATFPGVAIVLAVLSFNLVGDGIRDALDPRHGRGERP